MSTIAPPPMANFGNQDGYDDDDRIGNSDDSDGSIGTGDDSDQDPQQGGDSLPLEDDEED